jgi:hypothetical protein
MVANVYGLTLTNLLGWINVQAPPYNATGNGTTDDTAAIQSAIAAAQAAGGGTVYFPAGTYLCTPTASPALSVTGNNVRLLGPSRGSAVLKKNGNGVLLSMSGPSTDPTGATHVRYCTLENLKINGNGGTGSCLQLYYADNVTVRDVFFTGNADVVVDCVELWDSIFINQVIESSTGAANSSTPNTYLRNSAAASGFGYSGDSCNAIKFIGCRWEGFGTGALWIVQGASGVGNPNNFYITDCKMETSSVQGGPHLKVDASCIGVSVNGLYCFSGNFAGGYSTAQNVIVWSAQASTLENVFIANGGVATINSGVDLYSGAASTAFLKNVIGKYTTAPTGSHIYFEASTADFQVQNCFSNTGSVYGGTIPTQWYQGLPVRQVAGAVADGSFTHTPLNGSTAVDSTNFNFYVRVGGSWYSVPVNATAGNVTASNNLLVAGTSSLGDNGAGEIQLHDATTVATTNPTAGSLIYSESASATPVKVRDVNGNVRSVVDGFFQLASSPTFTAAAQTATTVTLAVQASATYLMEACLIFSNSTGSTTPSWTGPSGATMQWNDTGTSTDYSSTIGATNNSYASNASTRMACFKGLLVTSSTAGSLTLTLGVSAGTTTLAAGTYLRLTRTK